MVAQMSDIFNPSGGNASLPSQPALTRLTNPTAGTSTTNISVQTAP